MNTENEGYYLLVKKKNLKVKPKEKETSIFHSFSIFEFFL
jgi:hypothetical protein